MSETFGILAGEMLTALDEKRGNTKECAELVRAQNTTEKLLEMGVDFLFFQSLAQEKKNGNSLEQAGNLN